jgi:hypothetical protein
MDARARSDVVEIQEARVVGHRSGFHLTSLLRPETLGI